MCVCARWSVVDYGKRGASLWGRGVSGYCRWVRAGLLLDIARGEQYCVLWGGSVTV